MAELLLSRKNGDVILAADLTGRRKLTVGRSRKCDVALKGAGAARHDAVLFDAGHTWMMVNTGSADGFLTSKGQCRCITYDSPEVWAQIGRLYAWIEGVAPAMEKSDLPPLPPDEIGIALRSEFADAFKAELRGEEGVLAQYGWTQRVTNETADLTGARLIVADASGNPIRRIPLTGLEKLCIGRSTRCDVIVNNLTVSRVHCLLYLERDRWYIADCESSTGTRVDDQRVGRRRLAESSVIEAGDVLMWVEGLEPVPAGEQAIDPAENGREEIAFPGNDQSAMVPTTEAGPPNSTRLSAFLDDNDEPSAEPDHEGMPADKPPQGPSRPHRESPGGSD